MRVLQVVPSAGKKLSQSYGQKMPKDGGCHVLVRKARGRSAKEDTFDRTPEYGEEAAMKRGRTFQIESTTKGKVLSQART